MSDRRFFVRQDGYKRMTYTWEVYAESFEEAESKVYEGCADLYDEDEWDDEYESIEEVTCAECDETDGYCECEKEQEMESANEFLAEIGL